MNLQATIRDYVTKPTELFWPYINSFMYEFHLIFIYVQEVRNSNKKVQASCTGDF